MLRDLIRWSCSLALLTTVAMGDENPCSPTARPEVNCTLSNNSRIDVWLQQQISNATSAGLVIKLPPSHTYLLHDTVIVDKPGIEIVGKSAPAPLLGGVSAGGDDRTVLKVDAPNWNLNSRAALAVKGTTEFKLLDVIMKGSSTELHNRSGAKSLYGIVLYGVSDSAICNVRMRYFGKTVDNPDVSHLVIISSEAGQPNNSVESALSAYRVNDESLNNTISNCEFIDSKDSAKNMPGLVPVNAGPRASFGVRFLTNWELTDTNGAPLPPLSFSNTVSGNTIEHCTFRGFWWNGVEIAGPATKNNMVKYNTFELAYQTAMEADKGARSNDFNWNDIELVRTQADVQDVPSGKKTTAYAIRDQGTGNLTPQQRLTWGNKYYKNNIFHVYGRLVVENSNQQPRTAAFMLANSDNVILRQNKVYLVEAYNQPTLTVPITVLRYEVKNTNFSQGTTTNKIPFGTDEVPREFPVDTTTSNIDPNGFEFWTPPPN